MTQEELLQVYLNKGYKSELFHAFLSDYNANIDNGCSELEALEKSYIFADTYEQQKKLGFSDMWANDYAQRAEDGYNEQSIFEDMEGIDEKDVRLFAHLQNKGQLYENVFVNACTPDGTLEVPNKYSIFSFVDEYITMYNNLISEGHNEIYAEAYLDSFYADDAEPDIFAQAIEDAIAHGYDKEKARYFATTCSFRYDYDGDRIPNTIKNLSTYPEEWQHSYIFHWLANAEARGNFVSNKEDFCKMFEQNCKCLDGDINEDDLCDVVIETLKEYNYTHSK